MKSTSGHLGRNEAWSRWLRRQRIRLTIQTSLRASGCRGSATILYVWFPRGSLRGRYTSNSSFPLHLQPKIAQAPFCVGYLAKFKAPATREKGCLTRTPYTCVPRSCYAYAGTRGIQDNFHGLIRCRFLFRTKRTLGEALLRNFQSIIHLR
jgi:hypothetical protein